jgi:hypothetical protein
MYFTIEDKALIINNELIIDFSRGVQYATNKTT